MSGMPIWSQKPLPDGAAGMVWAHQVSGAKILIVDDDAQFRRVMRNALASEGYEVSDASGGQKALESLRRDSPDVVLLDMVMPDTSGLETCRAIRAFSAAVVVLAVSVRNREEEMIDALDAGADDYVTKPFRMPELLARIRAALRRAPLAKSDRQVLRTGELEIDFVARRVVAGGREVRLTRKEFDLLQYLASNPNTSLPHRTLLQAVWGPGAENEIVYLRVFIGQLRKKIEPEPHKPRFILTEPCVGYQFRLPGARSVTGGVSHAAGWHGIAPPESPL